MKTYIFDPQPDITAYELALIFKNARMGHSLSFGQMTVRPEDESNKEWQAVKRHYKEKGK